MENVELGQRRRRLGRPAMPDLEDRQYLGAYISKDQGQALDAMCARLGTTKSKVLRAAVAEFLERHRDTPPEATAEIPEELPYQAA